MKKELLMTIDQFYTIDNPVPYSYILSKDNQYIYYFGSRHSYNPEDEQFETIRAFLNDFISNTTKEKSIVLVEGGERPVAESEKEAILNGGEMEFVTYLANTHGRKVTSPEISEQERFRVLHQHFAKEEIAYYCFIQVCWQWNRTHDKKDFKEYIKIFLKNDHDESGWHDVDFTYEGILRIHDRLFHTSFDPQNTDFLASLLDPRKKTSIINDISRFDDSGLRDNFVLDQINEYWGKGVSVFIIYGTSHAVMQEPVLRSLIE